MLAYNKTRLAPTPSGYLHLGNVFSFAITSFVAKKVGARVLLRIDDMDRGRAEGKYVDDIFETLRFLKIEWDEGPCDKHDLDEKYSQIHRIGLYNEALDRLRNTGKVFACTCSRSQILANNAKGFYAGTCRNKNIPLDMENVSWRLDTEGASPVSIMDIKGSSHSISLPADMEYFVIRKKDGFPSYQLTSVVDDLFFGIDLVVRGEDLQGSTIAQLYLSRLLPANHFSKVAFMHHPLILGANRQKLSKSAGDTSVQYLRYNGCSPSDIYMLIAKKIGLGSNIGSGEELVQSLGLFQ